MLHLKNNNENSGYGDSLELVSLVKQRMMKIVYYC